VNTGVRRLATPAVSLRVYSLAGSAARQRNFVQRSGDVRSPKYSSGYQPRCLMRSRGIRSSTSHRRYVHRLRVGSTVNAHASSPDCSQHFASRDSPTASCVHSPPRRRTLRSARHDGGGGSAGSRLRAGRRGRATGRPAAQREHRCAVLDPDLVDDRWVPVGLPGVGGAERVLGCRGVPDADLAGG
jgi:hypothetical protein